MTEDDWLDLAMAEPDSGSVVRMRIAFPGSPVTYDYAAIRAGALWYVTGSKEGTQGRRWVDVLKRFKDGNATVLSAAVATSWENL